MTTARHPLCALADIADPGGKGFVLADGRRVFVIRKDNAVYGYVNRCPHAGTPLDWNPDVFLDADKTAIQCATHSARFRIGGGYCVAGPCAGKTLEPFPVRLAAGMVVAAGEDR